MEAYFDILDCDITKVRHLSTICRGEWCRILEADMDALQYELTQMRKYGGKLERARLEAMLERLQDAYRKLGTDCHT